MAKNDSKERERLEQNYRELVQGYKGILERLAVLQKKRAALHKEILSALDRAKAQDVLKKIKRLR